MPRPTITDCLFPTQLSNFVTLFSALLYHLAESTYSDNLKWLVMDMPLDVVTTYLPTSGKGVASEVSFSNLLEAFRDMYREELFESVKRKVCAGGRCACVVCEGEGVHVVCEGKGVHVWYVRGKVCVCGM